MRLLQTEYRMLTKAMLGIGILVVCSAQVMAQKIYRYEDADGNTVYAQSVPIGVKAEEIKPRFRVVLPETARAALDRLSGRAREAEQNRELSRSVADAASDDAQRKKENCEQARKNMAVLTGGAQRVQTTDEAGNLFTLDDEGLKAKTAQTQSQIDEFCK